MYRLATMPQKRSQAIEGEARLCRDLIDLAGVRLGEGNDIAPGLAGPIGLGDRAQRVAAKVENAGEVLDGIEAHLVYPSPSRATWPP
jgi:hypothetical protein